MHSILLGNLSGSRIWVMRPHFTDSILMTSQGFESVSRENLRGIQEVSPNIPVTLKDI